jgi:hypothetical protein
MSHTGHTGFTSAGAENPYTRAFWRELGIKTITNTRSDRQLNKVRGLPVTHTSTLSNRQHSKLNRARRYASAIGLSRSDHLAPGRASFVLGNTLTIGNLIDHSQQVQTPVSKNRANVPLIIVVTQANQQARAAMLQEYASAEKAGKYGRIERDGPDDVV